MKLGPGIVCSSVNQIEESDLLNKEVNLKEYSLCYLSFYSPMALSLTYEVFVISYGKNKK